MVYDCFALSTAANMKGLSAEIVVKPLNQLGAAL
jgi:hypothetical protein